MISKFAKLFGNLSYISVNADMEFEIYIPSFDKVTAINVLEITAIRS